MEAKLKEVVIKQLTMAHKFLGQQTPKLSSLFHLTILKISSISFINKDSKE
jgi:hypothetical protein